MSTAASTLARRYGTPAATTEGWASIPNVVLRTHRALGVTGPHWELCEAIWLDWRADEPPRIALATLAARLDVSERTIERYTAALEARGLLHVDRRAWVRGHRQLNAYDLRPLIAAALAQTRPAAAADETGAGGTTLADTPSLDQPTPGRQLSKNAAQENKHLDRDSNRARGREPDAMCSSSVATTTINAPPPWGGEKDARSQRCPGAESAVAAAPEHAAPPAPTSFPPPEGGAVDPPLADAGLLAETRPPRPALDDDDVAAPAGTAAAVQLPLDPDDQALVGPIQALVYELGDDAPASSITRAQHMRRAAGVSAGQFLRVLDEATARTRARQETIRKRRRDGHSVNGMPYLFAVLQDLLAPAAARRRPGGHGRGRGGQGYEEARRAAVLDTYGPYPEPPPPDMPAAWRDTLDDLRRSFVACTYVRWLRPTCVLGQEGDVLRIGVPDAFHAQWLDRRLRGLIERTMARTAPGLRVEFVTYVSVTAATPGDAR